MSHLVQAQVTGVRQIIELGVLETRRVSEETLKILATASGYHYSWLAEIESWLTLSVGRKAMLPEWTNAAKRFF